VGITTSPAPLLILAGSCSLTTSPFISLLGCLHHDGLSFSLLTRLRVLVMGFGPGRIRNFFASGSGIIIPNPDLTLLTK
jgi:hypothetical protein